MANLTPYRIIMSGGGTGGHIFPAIAIADALKKQLPNCEILFVGAEGKMEMEKVPKCGYKIHGLPIVGIQRSFSLENLKLPFKLYKSLQKAKEIIATFKPHLVVGTGGFASGPILWAAQRSDIKTAIQEQNAYAGLTNKLLAKKIKRAYVAFNGMEKWFPNEVIMVTGNPIRSGLSNLNESKEKAFAFFKLNPEKPVLLITGGSLGALTLNKAVAKHLSAFVEQGIQIIWQTGKNGESLAKIALEAIAKKDGIYISTFIESMNLAFAAASMVVSRAGASSISELAVVQKPCVLVPSPNVAEDHQTKNAMVLVEANAAILVTDDQAEASLFAVVSSLLKDEALQQKLISNLAAFGKMNAADVIANDLISLIA